MNCSSSDLRSPSRPSPNTWSGGGDDPAGQSWATFVRNHAPQIAAMDLFVVPTIGFDLLYALIIVQLDRRELVWVNGARKYRLRRWAPSLMASVVRCKSRDPASRIRRSSDLGAAIGRR